MFIDVLNHFGLARSPREAGYFETEHHQQLLHELEAAVPQGGLIALAGIVGSGKTTLLWQLQDRLRKAGRVLVAESLAVDINRVSLNTLKLAMYYDLATEKDGDLPSKPEKSERVLINLIQRCDRPVVLFVDDAHDLNGNTVRGLKRIIERVRRRGGRLSVLLGGHPKLKNDLRRATLEEIGGRAIIFELEGLKGQQKAYLTWLLSQCMKPKTNIEDILTEEAMALLSERLITPLQIEHYLILALEQAYRLAEKPVTAEIVESTIAPDLNALEPTLIRHGYTSRALSEFLNVRPGEVRALLPGQLPEERTDELKQQLLRTGIPL
ncbi:MAG: AAA family ATPase [Chromatiaceae bacterium]|nr:AAA family ATPase [Chromatiaceae bacterium]